MLREGPYPYALKQRVAGPRGHLSNPDCARFATELAGQGTRQFILSHLSDKNNTPVLARRQTEAALADVSAGCAVTVAPKEEMAAPVALCREEARVCCPSA